MENKKKLDFKEKWQKFWKEYRKNADIEKAKNEFANDFMEIMTEASIYTASYKTFKLENVVLTEYGFSLQIYNPLGLKFKELEEAVELIEDGIGCTFIITKIKRQKYIWAKVVINDVVKDLEFDVSKLYVERKTEITEEEEKEILNDEQKKLAVQILHEQGKIYKVTRRYGVKPYEFFIGYDTSGKPVVINMVHYAHLLITGSTRSGKSKLLDCILTSLIYYNSPQDLELYLFQIAKNDLLLYRKYKQVRGYAKTLEQAVELLEHIVKEMDRRADLIAPMHEAGLGNNILEYNKRYPQMRLPFIHVVFDEMSSLIDIEGEDDETKKLKKRIIKNVTAITQYGGAVGVNAVNSLQRATHDKLPPFAKANCNLVITFKQNNQKSSEVAIGDPQLALGLEQREIVYRTTEYDYAKVPLIHDRPIVKTLENWADPNHKMYEYGKREEGNHKGNKKDKNKSKKEEKQEQRETETMDVIAKAMEMMAKAHEQTAMSLAHKEATYSKPDITLPEKSPVYDKVAPQSTADVKKVMEESISKIEGYVPWTPLNPNRTVHDQTKFDPSKTGKPIKKDKGSI